MLPDYQVVLRSRDDGSVKIIFGQEEFNSVFYSRLHNDIGKFTIELDATDYLYSLFLLDDFIEIERRNPSNGLFEVQDSYFVRSFNRFLRGNNDTMIFGGPSLDHLLKRRVINPNDDPLAAGGFSIKAGFADAIIRELVDEQLGASASAARQAPDFTVNTVSNIGLNVGDKYSYQNNLFDVVKDLALRGGIDFKISRDSGRATVMNIGKFGSDLTVGTNQGFTPMALLQPSKGNLVDPALRLDYMDQITSLYAMGNGAGNTRVIINVPSGEEVDSPFNRIEAAEDFRDLDSGTSLISAGLGALRDKRASEEFSFVIDSTLAGSVLGLDFDLYDTISIDWQIQRDFRVTSIEVRFGPDGETVEIGVSNAE